MSRAVAKAAGADLADLDEFDGEIVDAETIDNRIPGSCCCHQMCRRTILRLPCTELLQLCWILRHKLHGCRG